MAVQAPQAAAGRDEVPDGFRVVYLVGDPRDAVLSIFRRNYQFGHYGVLHGHEPDADAAARAETLETFADAGIDDFASRGPLRRLARIIPTATPCCSSATTACEDAWAELNVFVGLPRSFVFLPARTLK